MVRPEADAPLVDQMRFVHRTPQETDHLLVRNPRLVASFTLAVAQVVEHDTVDPSAVAEKSS